MTIHDYGKRPTKRKERAVSKQPCPSCGHIHAADWAVAIGRFQGAVRAYRARYDDSPVRSTRDAAEADMCAHKQGGAA